MLILLETSLIGKALDFGSSDYGFESRVSKMIYNYFYNYVINHLHINSAKKSLKFEIVHSRKVFNLLCVFKKLGCLKSFFIFKNNKNLKIRIFIYFYKKSPIFKNFKLISTPSKSFCISLKALKLLHNRTQNSLYLLSTTKGIITHLEALRFKIGGQLLLLITL